MKFAKVFILQILFWAAPVGTVGTRYARASGHRLKGDGAELGADEL